MYYYFRAN